LNRPRAPRGATSSAPIAPPLPPAETPQGDALCSLVSQAWESFLIPGITEAQLDEITGKTVLMGEEIAEAGGVASW